MKTPRISWLFALFVLFSLALAEESTAEPDEEDGLTTFPKFMGFAEVTTKEITSTEEASTTEFTSTEEVTSEEHEEEEEYYEEDYETNDDDDADDDDDDNDDDVTSTITSTGPTTTLTNTKDSSNKGDGGIDTSLIVGLAIGVGGCFFFTGVLLLILLPKSNNREDPQPELEKHPSEWFKNASPFSQNTGSLPGSTTSAPGPVYEYAAPWEANNKKTSFDTKFHSSPWVAPALHDLNSKGSSVPSSGPGPHLYAYIDNDRGSVTLNGKSAQEYDEFKGFETKRQPSNSLGAMDEDGKYILVASERSRSNSPKDVGNEKAEQVTNLSSGDGSADPKNEIPTDAYDKFGNFKNSGNYDKFGARQSGESANWQKYDKSSAHGSEGYDKFRGGSVRNDEYDKFGHSARSKESKNENRQSMMYSSVANPGIGDTNDKENTTASTSVTAKDPSSRDSQPDVYSIMVTQAKS
eukprot:m.159826 g.159826  ORF g.159826 m.159826 type:complete len:465 (+) comp15159_c0_seq7:2038-3432(+)